MGLVQHVGEAAAELVGSGLHTVLLLPLCHVAVERLLQGIGLRVVGAVEVNLKDRVGLPLRLQVLYLQALEQVPAALKIVFDGGDQQRFAEAAGAAEKIDALALGQFIYQVGLVDIDKAVAS